MAEHYHDENDLKLMREMRKLAPDDFNAWLDSTISWGGRMVRFRENTASSSPSRFRARRSARIAWRRTPRRRTLPARRARKLSKLR